MSMTYDLKKMGTKQEKDLEIKRLNEYVPAANLEKLDDKDRNNIKQNKERLELIEKDL